jgi:serine/threonine-protein kinase HipA
MTEPVRHLAVLLGGRHVADLTRTRARAVRLTYLEAALGTGGTPLSLSLPLGDREHVGAPVERFLRGLVPENAGALAAIGRRHRIDPSDLLAVLAVIGKDCAGAVQLCREDEVEETIERPGSIEPFSDGEIEARLDALDTDENASWTMPGEHWSLGGTQQKLALHRRGDSWFLAHGARPTTHIIKPGIRRMAAQALVEHASMQVARRLGLDAAQTEYRSFKSRDALVVERFDRLRVGDQVVRLHQEDLCQALGVEQKYQEYGGPSALDVVRLLRAAADTSAQARGNVARFVDALVLNTVIGAPDAHARNVAVLLAGDSVELAPMYDVATGFAYDTAPENRRVLSMSVGGSYLVDEIDAEAWRRFAADAQVDGEALVERVAELSELAPPAFDEVLREAEGFEGAGSVRQRIGAGFAAHRGARPARG